jgi:phosphomevalonate kinase
MINENVLYVICPGSGGFDALFMLASGKKSNEYYEQLIESVRLKH